MPSTVSSSPAGRTDLFVGTLAAVAAFVLWGVLPLYWAQIATVPAIEIIWHRLLWGGVLAWVVVFAHRFGRFRPFGQVRREGVALLPGVRTTALLFANGLVLGTNWVIYVWAVSSGRTLDASLGYYINPLVNVLFGMVFFRERLRPLQWVAVAFAVAGVIFMSLQIGTTPWVSLAIAGSFGLYGVVKKKTVLSSIHSLSVELLPFMVIAAVMIARGVLMNDGHFLAGDRRTTAFLLGASAVTVAPLLLFGIATRRIRLADVGFLQYIAPTLMFLIAITVFGDPIYPGRLAGFILVWTGLAIYTSSNIAARRGRKR
ncbi:MAG: EamA family transporter RarD [Alkalispirochaeta sp.]